MRFLKECLDLGCGWVVLFGVIQRIDRGLELVGVDLPFGFGEQSGEGVRI